jgi:hypothetical protein
VSLLAAGLAEAYTDRTMTWRRLLCLVLLSVGPPALASESGLSGSDGHPRSRFPLGVYATALGDARLDDAVTRALVDWNRVTQEALGVHVFARVDHAPEAQIVLTFEPSSTRGLMGQTVLSTGPSGVIGLPVHIVAYEPSGRGETVRETVLYQVVAHELGHALGLPHTADPRSVMCCLAGSVDFNDPAARDVYVQARRHPDLRSVAPQLTAQYESFWKRHREEPK